LVAHTHAYPPRFIATTSSYIAVSAWEGEDPLRAVKRQHARGKPTSVHEGTASTVTVHVFHAVTRALVGLVGHTHLPRPLALAFSADGHRLAVCDAHTRRVVVLRAPTQAALPAPPGTGGGPESSPGVVGGVLVGCLAEGAPADAEPQGAATAGASGPVPTGGGAAMEGEMAPAHARSPSGSDPAVMTPQALPAGPLPQPREWEYVAAMFPGSAPSGVVEVGAKPGRWLCTCPSAHRLLCGVEAEGPGGDTTLVWGQEGDGPGQFYQPTALARVPGLGLVVRERGGERLQVRHGGGGGDLRARVCLGCGWGMRGWV
jgi:hypothetical protein